MSTTTNAQRNASIPEGVAIQGPMREGYEAVLTPEALAFVADLVRTFRPRIEELLAARKARQARLDSGEERFDFLPGAEERWAKAWTVAPLPAAILDRRVEITGPVDRKMIVNALNSGASVFMADFEDATTPTWDNQLRGQQNLFDAVRRTIRLEQGGKTYELKKDVATLFVRPRGLHLPEKHLLVDGKITPGSLFDFGLFFFHNAKEQLARGFGPYFYIPKLESHLEARLWNDVFVRAQEKLGVPRGSIKATVLIETLPAAFEMDEILFELREHSAGLNCGRWDYIFSFIKKRRADRAALLPDRGQVTMDKAFLAAYVKLLVETCHRRGVHAMGGMAAQIPIKDDPTANEAALAKVRADKKRERTSPSSPLPCGPSPKGEGSGSLPHSNCLLKRNVTQTISKSSKKKFTYNFYSKKLFEMKNLLTIAFSLLLFTSTSLNAQNGQTRTEKDLLGEKQIPADAYYGVQTLRALENFQVSGVTTGFYPDYVKAYAMVKLAAARANNEVGRLSNEKLAAIEKACKAVMDGKYRDQFLVDLYQGGAGTSANMNANEVLANIALEMSGHKKGEYQYIEPHDDLNMGQSTNDVYPTTIHVALLLHNDKLIAEAQLLSQAFHKKGDQFNDLLKMGRTEGQDAVPMTLGQEFNGFGNQLDGAIEALRKSEAYLYEENMGATAIGTGLTATPGYAEKCAAQLAKITGKPMELAHDLIAATSSAFISACSAVPGPLPRG